MQTPARAADDPRMAERSAGRADAKLTVDEYFSLTCTHCAAFARETFPQVKTALIDTGKIRLVFRDFPLDQLGLTASMVARALAPERYEPFIMALFASQDRWAFARNVNNFEEIWKLAALAGMNRATFDATVADNALKTAILAAQDAAVKRWKINSTPSFVIKGETYAGALAFERFNQVVTAALS
jgi:protein-disulfide isomerase